MSNEPVNKTENSILQVFALKAHAYTLYTALGAALGFYCLFPLFRSKLIGVTLLFLPLLLVTAALCFFRVLASYPTPCSSGGLLAFTEGEESVGPTPCNISSGNALTGSGALIGRVEYSSTRLLKSVPLRITAFAVGLALGIGAGVSSSAGVVFGLPENNIRGVTGTLLEDPRIVSGARAMATLSLGMVAGESGVRASARGGLPVFFPEESAGRLQEFGRGAEVAVEGYLRVTEGGNFGRYLFSADSLHVTKPAPPIERFRTGLRLSLIRRFSRPDNTGVPWGGLSQALLLGVRDNLDSGLAAAYRNAGSSYLLALSGMHLALIAALVSLLLKRPLGLRLAAVTGAVIIIGYCLLVGPMPSLNRAALMYLLGVLAVLGMLKRDAFSLLCTAFVIQLVVTPQAGLSPSFILSYSALAGILILGGMINRIFKGKIPDFFLLPLSASLGAFIATAGITAFVFTTLRPVGLIAGLVLAPLTTVFMIGSIVWLFLDFVSPVVSSILNWPLALLYTLQDKAAGVAAHVPGFDANPHLILWLSLALIAFIVWFDFRKKAAANRLDDFE